MIINPYHKHKVVWSQNFLFLYSLHHDLTRGNAFLPDSNCGRFCSIMAEISISENIIISIFKIETIWSCNMHQIDLILNKLIFTRDKSFLKKWLQICLTKHINRGERKKGKNAIHLPQTISHAWFDEILHCKILQIFSGCTGEILRVQKRH